MRKATVSVAFLSLFINPDYTIMHSPLVTSILPKIKEYFKGQRVKKAWLFGSFSRNEETETGHIDVLMGLRHIIGREVDLVEVNGILDFAKATIDRDKILIYERD